MQMEVGAVPRGVTVVTHPCSACMTCLIFFLEAPVQSLLQKLLLQSRQRSLNYRPAWRQCFNDVAAPDSLRKRLRLLLQLKVQIQSVDMHWS